MPGSKVTDSTVTRRSVSLDFHFELLLVFGVRLTRAHAVAADDRDFKRSDLNILAAFLAIAEKRSFTKTAKRLAVSPSTMSPAIRGLEETPGVRLLSRATCSVAPTEAGEQLLARLRPARFLRPDRPGRME
jgi:hypothetical protein